jgi:hypothetical protein
MSSHFFQFYTFTQKPIKTVQICPPVGDYNKAGKVLGMHRSGDPTLSGPPAMLVHGRVGGHEADMRPNTLPALTFLMKTFVDIK